MQNEDRLIAKITRTVPSVQGSAGLAGLRIGIGHDAAVGSPRPGHEWALHSDAFLDGVHFRRQSYPADSVGYKSLMRATSDLAATGATPRFFLLTLALSPRCTPKWLGGFLRGMARGARLAGIRLAGGDTTRSDRTAISVTVIGEVRRGLALTRRGARPGDTICVSGRLGRAALGLELMNRLGKASRPLRHPELARLLKPHLYPKIRLELGAWLAENRLASAMMDLSDGLSTDLHRLCKASRVGARLSAGRIPCVEIPAGVARLLGGRRLDPLQLALHGGDDYELLFTVPRRKLKQLQRAPGFSGIAAIGEIERASQVALVGAGGRARPLQPGGWDPFRPK